MLWYMILWSREYDDWRMETCSHYLSLGLIERRERGRFGGVGAIFDTSLATIREINAEPTGNPGGVP